MDLQVLLDKRMGLVTKQEEILNLCSKEVRNMTVDEKSTFDKLDTEIGNIENTVDSMRKFKDKNKVSTINNDEDLEKQVVNSKVKDKGDGFDSFGEMLRAVANANLPYGRMEGAGMIDNRLNFQNAATGMSSTVPSEGGFLIGTDRSNQIMKKMYEDGVVLNACDKFEISSNSDSLEIPYVDETSRANGSRWGGLRAYREGETDTPTATKTKLGLWECRVSDIKAIVYVTERLLQDTTALQALIDQQLSQEFTFKVEDEIFNGAGGASCKGIIGDPATVSVAKETGQTATTIVAENIIKMYTRMWGRSRQGAAWYINQDIEPELFTMAFSVGTGGVPVYLPANGLSASPYGTLFGKPVKPVEQAATLGTVGDINFCDFGEYAIVQKGGLNSAASMHVRFIYDEMCFKFNMRINGKPKWKSALTPFKGSSTLSPFVTLATRS